MKKFVAVKTNSIGDAMYAGDHNFNALMVPVYLASGKVVPDRQAVVRSDNGAYLGTVGKGYTPVQPAKFYDMVDKLVAETKGTIDQVLNLRNGSVMGVGITMGDTEYVPGDPINRSFVLMTSFDCSYSVMGRAISRRWVCTNQLPSSKRIFNLKHTANVELRMETAMKMLSYLRQEINQFDGRMARFVRHRMTNDQMMEWFDTVMPTPEQTSDRSKSRSMNVKAEFINLLHTGRGVDLPGVRGTAYHALNALTEYCNHQRTTRVRDGRDEDEVRFESVTFGSADQLMQRGVEELLRLTM